MIKQEIIEKISKYFKLTDYEAEKVYDDIFSIIVTGVNEDNIVDVANFGEFIIKYNNGKSNGNGNNQGSGNGYKKTVEFLASTNFEEELNQVRLDEPKQTIQEVTPPVVPPAHDVIEGSSVEEELRKKREEILSKITGPILPRSPLVTSLFSEPKKEEKIHTPEPDETEEQIPAEESVTEELIAEETKTEDIAEEPKTGRLPLETESLTDEVKSSLADEVKSVEETAEEKIEEKTGETAEITAGAKTVEEGLEDISHRSFSDYFSEVSEETKPVVEQKPVEEPIEKPIENVIPKSAVLLHNEIMGSESKSSIIPEEPPVQQTRPVMETAEEPESRADDNSYYIWYKDSESNPTDTQTLSYEYELLYQATKEAEYKSKLKIYVTTFIIFFSIVLLLLIFSPVIYKIFFSPEEIQNIENTQEEPPGVSEQKAVPNVIEENISGQQELQTQGPPPADTNAQKQTQVTQEQNTQTEQQNAQQQQTPPVKQEEKNSQEPQKSLEQAGNQKQQKQTQPPPNVEKKIDGVSQNAMGWQDEKYNVIYIQLENGKFAIQESAWNSDEKAKKRISAVESLGIAGLKGNVVSADLGAKGTWYRVRFGEFSTIEEARGKAAELRKKFP